MDGNPRVVFDSLKKNYNHGEEITTSFCCKDYEPEADDWIGIFALDIEPCDTPFSYERISLPPDKDALHKKFMVNIKTDFIPGNISLFQLRYVDTKRKIIGKSTSFSLTPLGNQSSFITVKESVLSDDSLVLIDKVSQFKERNSEHEQEQLVDTSLYSKSDEDFLNIVSSLQINDEAAEGQTDDNSERKQSPTPVDAADATEVVSLEIERRKSAEKALEMYARGMSKQMYFIQEQGDDLVELQNKCNRQEMLNQCLHEECEGAEETLDSYAAELVGVKNIAANYKHECSRLRKKNAHADDMMDRLKNQIMDEHNEYQEKYEALREKEARDLKIYRYDIQKLEAAMENECKQADRLRAELRTMEENHEAVISKLADTMDSKNEEIGTLREKLEAMTKKYENKTTDKASQQEEIIDRLEKDLKVETENRIKIFSEYEKTIEELESRVVNESTKASRVENDLAVAENRFKEATDDIKFFRQKVLETEQKLQVSQNQLAKSNEEIFNLKVILSSDTTDTESVSRMSMISDMSAVDDKSTVGGSSCVSASASVENLPDRQRHMGDVTDEEDNSWCARSQSFESLGAVISLSKGKAPAGLIQVRKEIMKSVSDTGASEKSSQPIPIVEARRPAKKGHRKYGKPIDLTPSSSTTTVSNFSNFSERKDNNITFSKNNIVDLERPVLEKQYIAIRQHRNSLIRENNYLKSKVCALKGDLIFTEKNLQNISLEAEHKIGMLLVAISNQEFVSPQEIQSLIQMFPFSAAQYMAPTYQQHSQQSTMEEMKNTSDGGYLSPYAPEYKPNNQQAQYQSSPSLYLPPTSLPYIQYMANQDNTDSSYIIPAQSVPSQLPPTPGVLNNGLVDASDQLAAIGIPISKTF